MNPHIALSLFHLLIVVPLLLYIGFQRTDTPSWIYYAIGSIGAIIFFYHGFRLVQRLAASSPNAWINAIHVLLIAPLLMYLGFHQKESPRAAYELLLLLAFGALGYHLFSLVRRLQTHDTL